MLTAKPSIFEIFMRAFLRHESIVGMSRLEWLRGAFLWMRAAVFSPSVIATLM
jgi:hypothetical protein